jgi:hypothetical protein
MVDFLSETMETLDKVAQACAPSCLGDDNQEDHHLRPDQLKISHLSQRLDMVVQGKYK